MNTVGKNITLTFFGESHSPYIGVTIDHLPPGIEINNQLINFNLGKRRPKSIGSTSRIELDEYEFISGIKNNITTGAPLTALIKNKDIQSSDYPNLNVTPRPSHADFPASIKYNGYNDYLGGGMFSGRLTALWVIVGSISQQILEKKNIYIGSHIYSIYKIKDSSFKLNDVSKEELIRLNQEEMPLNNSNIKNDINDLILETVKKKDSIGGVIESAIVNMPIGVGEPILHSIEGYLSYLLFSIPSVKGIEFGSGFDITQHYGSEVNDEYVYEFGHVSTKNNHNGGCLGGLSTGRPIIIKTAIKPIASIDKDLDTVNTEKQTNTKIHISGRHDSQIITRVHPVINAVLNFGILDLMYGELF